MRRRRTVSREKDRKNTAEGQAPYRRTTSEQSDAAQRGVHS